MASFSTAYNAVIVPHEGGYLSQAMAIMIGDSGGETYKGVSRTNNPTWSGWKIIDNYKANYGIPKHNSYIPSVSLDQAVKDLAKSNYWDANKLSLVNNQSIANLLFDITYNSGPRTAALAAQRVLNIEDDGIVGNQTITAINKANPSKLLTDLVNYRINWLNTYQAGKSYLDTLINRTQSYLKGATAYVNDNKPVFLIGTLLLLTAGGVYLYNRNNE